MAKSFFAFILIAFNWSFLISIEHFDCGLPEIVVCQSSRLIRLCESERKCNVIREKFSDAEPVNLTLYYEALCPGCKKYISTIAAVYPDIKSILNLDLVPYGNAKEVQKGDIWEFTCQHGKDECFLNMLEACAIHFYGIPKAFNFISCLEKSKTPLTVIESCCAEFGLKAFVLYFCSINKLGNRIMHEMALKTEALDPPHSFVPWVTINGDGSEEVQQKAEENLLKLICDTYQGIKPSVCEDFFKKRCYKD